MYGATLVYRIAQIFGVENFRRFCRKGNGHKILLRNFKFITDIRCGCKILSTKICFWAEIGSCKGSIIILSEVRSARPRLYDFYGYFLVDFKTSLYAGFFSIAMNDEHGFLPCGTFIGASRLQYRHLDSFIMTYIIIIAISRLEATGSFVCISNIKSHGVPTDLSFNRSFRFLYIHVYWLLLAAWEFLYCHVVACRTRT